jgi:hypothetical protein
LTDALARRKLKQDYPSITYARLLAMSAYPPPPPGIDGIGRRIEEAVELIELELRHTIAFINDAVIPQVRSESISAIRTLADRLRELADRFEKQPKGPQP